MASKQKLSAKARKAKAIRDKKCAMTPDRKRKKAHSQRVRRAAIKKGKNIKGKDWDHKDGRFETIARNRANDGKGTKREGKKKYKVPTRKA
jgi:hypothetical protein|tara:strand:+ start:40 stop:312 length:273 start_codon:yes stop_codon:yes gene_type:complete